MSDVGADLPLSLPASAAAPGEKREPRGSCSVRSGIDLLGEVYAWRIDAGCRLRTRWTRFHRNDNHETFFDAMESGHPYVLTLDGMIGADGGLPLIENGKVIGGIGTSGGTGAQDAIVSKAGADTVK